MKVICPKNKRHSRFSVTAHVTQDWKVDSNAQFIEVIKDCMDVTHMPDKGDLFTCLNCGAEAKVED